jgi:rubredoxin
MVMSLRPPGITAGALGEQMARKLGAKNGSGDCPATPQVWRKLEVTRSCPHCAAKNRSRHRVAAYGVRRCSCCAAFGDQTMATAPIGQDRFTPLVQKLSTARAFGFRRTVAACTNHRALPVSVQNHLRKKNLITLFLGNSFAPNSDSAS